MALHLVSREVGSEVAQAVQLGLEYDPQPPFDAGSPAKAPAQIVDAVTASAGSEERLLHRAELRAAPRAYSPLAPLLPRVSSTERVAREPGIATTSWVCERAGFPQKRATAGVERDPEGVGRPPPSLKPRWAIATRIDPGPWPLPPIRTFECITI